MVVSVRVITIIDQKYTVELEVEEDNWFEMWKKLNSSPWGRRVLHLVTTMLPNYPEVRREDEPNVNTETEEKTEEESSSET